MCKAICFIFISFADFIIKIIAVALYIPTVFFLFAILLVSTIITGLVFSITYGIHLITYYITMFDEFGIVHEMTSILKHIVFKYFYYFQNKGRF